MEAIATLLNDDPYLKLTPAARRVAVKARRQFFDALRTAKQEPLPVILPVAQEHVELIADWIDRQKRIHQARIELKTDAPAPARPSVLQIQRACCDHFDFYLTELCSQRRLGRLVRARQIAMYLCRVLTNRSFPEIGRKFGGRDHTTVLHGVAKIGKRMADDPDLAEDIKILKSKLAELGVV